MVDIIAVTYNQNEILKCFINSIKSQTSNNWRLVIIHDGPNQKLHDELQNEKYIQEGKIEFIQHPVRTENYGHLLRKWGIENVIKNEYVLITNGDNYYTPNMIHEVTKRTEDFIYFNMVHSHNTIANHNKSTYGFFDSKIKKSYIDIGNVVVKSNISKKIGFNSVGFAADWDYIESVLSSNPSIYKIDKVLFIHN